jgi:hypothetical protein
VRTEDVEKVYRRYFDSIIHFCRSTPGYWDRKEREKEDIGRIKYISRTGMSDVYKVNDKKKKRISVLSQKVVQKDKLRLLLTVKYILWFCLQRHASTVRFYHL